MIQAVILAVVCVLAGANAGLSPAPILYTPVLTKTVVHSSPVGIVRGFPVQAAPPILYSSPQVVKVKTVGYSAPTIVHSGSPIAYASPVKTLAYSAPIVHHVQPTLVRVARSADPGLLAGPAVSHN